MSVKITKSPKRANAITHAGIFHADEVMATVVLNKCIPNLCVYRTNVLPKNIKKGVIVYDIGFGVYDHHQKGGNGSRENGVPYASVGLIWKDFGPELCKKYCSQNYKYVWEIIDRDLIQGIDFSDNGIVGKPKTIKQNYPRNISLPKAISGFNPGWDSSEDPDSAFIKAVEFADIVFSNLLIKAVSKVKAKEIVDQAIENSHEHIMLLDKYVPWQEFIFTSSNKKAEDVQFVVYPSDRGGFNWQCVPEKPNFYQHRKMVPQSWRGLTNGELQRITGIKTASFCHPAGFIGGAQTLEDTVEFAKKAVNS